MRSNPEWLAYERQRDIILFQLWQRSGGNTDLVSDSTNFSTSGFNSQVQFLQQQLNGLPEFTIDTTGFTFDSTKITFDKRSLSLESTSLPVLMNALEIEQILVNLIQNAIESGERGDSIRITARRVASVVRVEVHDSGRGISEQDLEHVFDPFFTTRLHSGGTGLGLSVAHGIARDHGGEIEIESTLGVGTTARLDLPLHDEIHVAPPAAADDDVTTRGEEN